MYDLSRFTLTELKEMFPPDLSVRVEFDPFALKMTEINHIAEHFCTPEMQEDEQFMHLIEEYFDVENSDSNYYLLMLGDAQKQNVLIF